MPSLRNMVGETGVIEIPVSNDEPLVVHYRRGVMTPRRQMKILQTQRGIATAAGDTPDPQVLMVMVELLADLIVSWNLTTDAGLPIPTDLDSLQDVEMEILVAIMTEIGRQGRPDPLSGDGSNNGSSPTASSGPRQIGSPSS